MMKLQSLVAVTALLVLGAGPATEPSADDTTMDAAPVGSTWKGARTANKDTFSVDGKITAHDPGSLSLTTSEQNGVGMEWNFKVKGSTLTLSSLRTTTRYGGTRKEEQVSGRIVDDKIQITYSWAEYRDRKKNISVAGQMQLTRVEEKSAGAGRKGKH